MNFLDICAVAQSFLTDIKMLF